MLDNIKINHIIILFLTMYKEFLRTLNLNTRAANHGWNRGLVENSDRDSQTIKDYYSESSAWENIVSDEWDEIRQFLGEIWFNVFAELRVFFSSGVILIHLNQIKDFCLLIENNAYYWLAMNLMMHLMEWLEFLFQDSLFSVNFLMANSLPWC